MENNLNLLGAIVAHIIFISSILTFGARILFKVHPGHWVGIPLLLMAFPLLYLLLRAGEFNRPFLYYLQLGLMLGWIILLYLVDFAFKVDFRQTRWMVIAFVMLYFAGIGGMVGVSMLAGRGWMISAIILFLIAAVLAFVQHNVTEL